MINVCFGISLLWVEFFFSPFHLVHPWMWMLLSYECTKRTVFYGLVLIGNSIVMRMYVYFRLLSYRMVRRKSIRCSSNVYVMKKRKKSTLRIYMNYDLKIYWKKGPKREKKEEDRLFASSYWYFNMLRTPFARAHQHTRIQRR